MSRTAAWRLDPSSYPHRVVLQTRFQDVDTMGHINNVAFGALFEAARVRFHHQLGLGEFRGHRWLVGRIAIDYLAEAYHPADIVVASGIGPIGNRSWRLLSLAMQDDRPVAICEAVLVMEAKPDVTTLPDDFRDRLRAFLVREG